MEFPKLENAEQARVLGLMLSKPGRGLEMLIAEYELLLRKIQDAGEHGDEEIEGRLHLIKVAVEECVRASGPLARVDMYPKVRAMMGPKRCTRKDWRELAGDGNR